MQADRRWTLEPEPDEVPRIRREVHHFVAGCERLSAARLRDLDLVVTEVVTNALLHGYRDEHRAPIEVDVHVDGHVEIVVRDRGVGMSPHPDSPGAGLGLAIVGKLADSFEVRAANGGGTEVRVVFE
jgi:anti-sigma regulatory factor (Ser/Thr protein kinase)